MELALLAVRNHVNDAILHAQLHGPRITATVSKQLAKFARQCDYLKLQCLKSLLQGRPAQKTQEIEILHGTFFKKLNQVMASRITIFS